MRHGTLSRMSNERNEIQIARDSTFAQTVDGQRLIRARDEIGREGRSMVVIAGQDSWMIEREEIIRDYY